MAFSVSIYLFIEIRIKMQHLNRHTKMAEDGEEDYMGDLSQLIPPEASLPPKSSSKKFSNSKTAVSSSSNKKAKTLNWQEQRKLNREQQQIAEDQQTLANLETAIPQSNVGFKMLKKMGYTPGSALGKEGSGRAEPVVMEIRRTRAGIGKEDPKVEKIRIEKQNIESKRIREEELITDFGYRQKERWKVRKILVNFWKAEAALAQLENREIVEVEKKEDEGEEKEEEEEEEKITEEDLHVILMRLRDGYHYCLFCGCQYESEEALSSSCPGINEDDH